MNQETDIIAKAFCPYEGCSFTPQTIYASTSGAGGDIEWLKGRKDHHNRTHDHQATVVIYSHNAELSNVV